MTTTSTPLQELHDSYVERVNMAISEDREDLVAALAKDFDDEVLGVILARQGSDRG